MIHWRREGDDIKQGLNLYHPDQRARSIGGCLRIGNRVWRVRYSCIARRWFIGTYKIENFDLGPRTRQQYDL